MKFIDKLKKSKNTKWVIIIIIAFFIYTSFLVPEKKEYQTEDYCNSLVGNGDDGFIRSNVDEAYCKSGECHVRIIHLEEDWWAWTKGKTRCVPIVLNGQYTNDGPGSCEEGSLKIEKTLWWDYYKCKAYTTGQECNGGQRAIAEILWGLGLDSLDCKSAYYLTIFGGGFLLLIGIV